MTGSQSTINSPSSFSTTRSTPWVLGCCGPMLMIIVSSRNSPVRASRRCRSSATSSALRSSKSGSEVMHLLLFGDASHAIVPFYGQGMNAGFEDCTVLAGLMDQFGDDWATILKTYEQKRKPNGDAVALAQSACGGGDAEAATRGCRMKKSQMMSG
mgnify:CR=1 FL=1